MIEIKTALISVYKKDGVLELAQKLQSHNVKIISSGGTASFLRENDIPVIEVSDYTGSPEMFDGRVKTLHPKIHAGILARGKTDEKQLSDIGADKIDLVVVNLYPFEEELNKKNVSEDDLIEKIDIGGPAMLRAAAKNFKNTVSVCSPEHYHKIKPEGMSVEESRNLAGYVFATTTAYDSLVHNWLHQHPIATSEFKQELRYGENPHQRASVTVNENSPIDFLNPLQGKAVSYNNVNDALAAWACVSEFLEPAVCIVKHANPCGVSESSSLLQAYENAFLTDPTSAFGGVIALNETLSYELAKSIIDKQFVEVIIAPGFEDDAKKILATKPNIRLLISKQTEKKYLETKSMFSVDLSQTSDLVTPEDYEISVVSALKPNESELKDLIFAMKVAKHVKSNAIVLAKNKMTLGIGAGQMSRVVSTKIALMKAKEEGIDVLGCALASDAFFPFRDNIDFAATGGIKHVIQPGGSVRDQEVIDAINEHDMSMCVTGIRHFKH